MTRGFEEDPARAMDKCVRLGCSPNMASEPMHHTNDMEGAIIMAGRFIVDRSRVPAYIQSTDDVRKEQQRLGVKVDGIWGPKTQTAYDKDRLLQTNDMPDFILSDNKVDKGILSMTDASFSGGDPYVAYAEYLENLGVKNKKSIADLSGIAAQVQAMVVNGNGNAKEKQAQEKYMVSIMPRSYTEEAANPYIEQDLVLGTMPVPTSYGQQSNFEEPKINESNLSSLEESEVVTKNMQHLEDEITEIEAAYKDIPTNSHVPWNTLLAIEWQYMKLYNKGSQFLYGFKNQWVYGYRDVIKAAAKKYDIPVELLAGVAWSEVGGDPPWIDPAAYFVRKGTTPVIPEQYWGKTPDEIANLPLIGGLWSDMWRDATKDPNKTSFGDLSMQIRVAAETLGISPNILNTTMEKEIIKALQNPKFSIFISAKHLADLKKIDFADIPSNKLSLDQIATIASRYNIGAGASYEEASGYSYGKDMNRHMPEIMKYVLLD